MKRPRRGELGFRPRKSASRHRPNTDSLGASARRLEERYITKPRQKKEDDMNEDQTAPTMNPQEQLEAAQAPEAPAAPVGQEAQESLDTPAETPAE